MDIPVSLPFSKAFDFASGAIAERFQNPFWKIKEFFFGSPLRKAIIEIKQFGDTLVTAAVHKKSSTASQNQPAAGKPNTPSQNNLIDALLDHIQDHQIVADAAMNYLSAGPQSQAPHIPQPLSPKRRQRHNSPIPNLGFLPSITEPARGPQNSPRTANHFS